MGKIILDSGESESDDGGVLISQNGEFKVNDEYAKRFTYNKKQEELRRLEDKYGKTSRKRKRDGEESGSESSSSSTDSEDEDDAGELATEALDSEIQATLDAIRSKDPRVYDEKSTFYTARDDGEEGTATEKEGKPMYLRDYHRETLLNTHADAEPSMNEHPVSYTQEQADLRRSVVGAFKAAAESGPSDDEEFDLVAKKQPKRKLAQAVELDVEHADRDPETYLSNFMAARAWVPTTQSRFQAFDSDDDEEERKAEEFEEAYNFRFEDPAKSNEKLRTHARDLTAKYSVRREETNSRKKKREQEKEKKEAEKQQLKDEKARLRKLRIEDVEEKVRRIKRAAGLSSKQIQPEDWARFVDDDWDDAKWEEEMKARFGEEYYAGEDIESDQEDLVSAGNSKNRKPKKPKWQDDIDIQDLIPDFTEEERPEFSLTDEETPSGSKTTSAKKSKEERRKEAKRDRRIIESVVDNQLDTDVALLIPSKAAPFRYRETSPTSFGLSSRDILLADDTHLNQFAGLKKLAAFRDPDKKRKDKKHLGKKARLRSWRKETFGHEDGLQESELVPKATKEERVEDEDQGVDIRTSGHKKRRRGNKQKTVQPEII